jgi:molybdopterin-binding protein
VTVRRHLYTPREAAQRMGISYPTIKKWILEGKIKTTKTPGGHHRLAPEYIKELSEQQNRPPLAVPESYPSITGINLLSGHVVSVRIEGLLAEIVLAIGDQRVTAIITAEAATALDLKAGDAASALIKSTDIMVGLPGKQEER